MRDELRAQLEALCLNVGGRYTLSTGQETHYYFDLKPALLNGSVLAGLAEAVLEETERLSIRPAAVGGLVVGADFLVAAVVLLAAQRGHTLNRGCVVRQAPKTHGTRNVVENAPPPGTPVVVVDDVFTTGGSTAYACRKIQEAGCRIVGIIGLIDREQGGVDALEREFGVPVRSLYKSSDFSGVAAHDQSA